MEIVYVKVYDYVEKIIATYLNCKEFLKSKLWIDPSTSWKLWICFKSVAAQGPFSNVYDLKTSLHYLSMSPLI